MRQIKNLEPRFDSIETEKALVVVAMNDGLGLDTVTVILLDDGGPVVVARFTLPDHGTIAIPVVVPVTLADGDTGANGSDANADLFRQCRRRKGANCRGNQQ
jgi:hypothetical protein